MLLYSRGTKLREQYIKAVCFIFFYIPVYKSIYSDFVRHLSEYLQEAEQLPKTSVKFFLNKRCFVVSAFLGFPACGNGSSEIRCKLGCVDSIAWRAWWLSP